MLKFMPLLHLLFLLYNSKALGADITPNYNIAFREVKLDLDHRSIPSNTVAVVNNLDPSSDLNPYTRYTLFNSDTVDFFTADPVSFGNRKLLIKGEALKVDYVYNVYTYWECGSIMAVGFRWHLGGKDSLYKYYCKEGNEWALCNPGSLGDPISGFLDDKNLLVFLDNLKERNLKRLNLRKPKEEYSSKPGAILLLAIVATIFVIVVAGIFLIRR